jgi:bifunctional non-homologous end joining protein LigD
MLWRARTAQVRSKLAPPGFIQPSRPSPSKKPPTGELWVHEVKHDGYRLQVHVRVGRVRLYTMNGADWTDRYPRIVEDAARLKGDAVLDCEVICQDPHGRADFDRLHSRCFEHEAIACAFDLLRLDGDMRRLPLRDRKAALRKLFGRTRGGIQYVAHAEMCGEEAFAAACELGIEGIVSKRLTAPYKSVRARAGSRSGIRSRWRTCGSLTARSDLDECFARTVSLR